MIKRSYPLLVILGPTATGKTDLAIHLAKKFSGELIACDSRQVYQGLDIGTGKMPNKFQIVSKETAFGRTNVKFQIEKANGYWKLDGIKVWMYDVVDPKIQYTVADFVKDADRVIREISKIGELPIIVGGTGLYLKALVEGLSSLETPMDKKLRKKLSNLSLHQLQTKLKKIALEKWDLMNNSDKYNPRRLIRAIELITPSKPGAKRLPRSPRRPRNDILWIGLTAPREIIYEKINNRVYKWIKDGIIDEVKGLIKSGISKKRFASIGLEYAVILEYLKGDLSYDQCLEKMQTKVRQYAKRQITWFKKEKDVFWFDITDKDYSIKIEKFISKWYDGLT